MKKTPTIISPFNLIQEQIRPDMWKMAAYSIIKNNSCDTFAKQEIKIIDIFKEFIQRFPTVESISRKKHYDEVKRMIEKTGYGRTKTECLFLVSRRIYHNNWKNFEDLRTITAYGIQNCKMFIGGELLEDSSYPDLQKYIDWANSLPQEDLPSEK